MTRRALIWTHDLLGEQNGVVSRDFLEVIVDDTLGGTQELRFAIPSTHPKRYLLALDIDLIYDGRRYFVDELVEDRTGPRTVVRVKAPAAWYRLGQFDVLGSLAIDNATPHAGLTTILAETEWMARGAPDTTDEYSLEQESRSVLEVVNTWAKITGTYAQFDTLSKTVSLSTTTGASRGIMFRAGRNLRNIERRNTAPEVTELVPYGENGITIESVNSGSGILEDYSYYENLGITKAEARERFRKRKTFNNSAIVTPRDLLSAGQAYLARLAQSVQRIELDVVDISSLTGIAEPLEVGDNVTAYDPDLGEEFVAFVTRYRRFPLEPHRNVVELSASPDLISDPNSTGGGSSDAQQWQLLVGPIAARTIRDDEETSAGAITVRLIPGARAHFHVDLWAVGVGDGTMHVRVVDTEDPDTQQHYRTVDVPYLDGVTVRASFEWATVSLDAATYTFEVMVSTTADGGPSAVLGVNTVADAVDPLESGFWIMARGATRVAPNVPQTPIGLELVGTVSDAALPTPLALVKDGIYCYVGNNTGNLFAVIDVSDPNSPLVVGSLAATGPNRLENVREMVKEGDLVYVAAHNYLTIVDVSNPAAPTVAGALNNTTRFFSGQAIIKDGNYCYFHNGRASGGSDYFSVVDVSNPALPVLVGDVVSDVGTSAGLVKDGDLVYLVGDPSGGTGVFRVFDVSNPAAPTIIGTLSDVLLNGGAGLVKDGDLCYVAAGGTDDVCIVDVIDPTAPAIIGGSIDTGGATGGPITKRFDFVYRSAPASDDFTIIDWSVISAPTIAATIQTPVNPWGFALDGDFVYVACVNGPSVVVLQIIYEDS
jgi:hypothetical protein